MLVGLKDGELLAERPASATNPAIEVCRRVPNGTDINAVWSHLSRTGSHLRRRCTEWLGQKD